MQKWDVGGHKEFVIIFNMVYIYMPLTTLNIATELLQISIIEKTQFHIKHCTLYYLGLVIHL